MKNKFTLDTTSVPFFTHASCMIQSGRHTSDGPTDDLHPVKTKTMDVTQ